jgi:hypothetical protein
MAAFLVRERTGAEQARMSQIFESCPELSALSVVSIFFAV